MIENTEVESRDHFKKRGVPKILTSRKITKFKQMIMLSITSIVLQAPSSGSSSVNFFLLLIFLAFVIILVAVKSSKGDDVSSISTEQTNKVINITLTGGIIGLFADSPQRSLNSRIKKENANGWKVVQVIPAESGNILLLIFRLLLLVITLFLFTTTNGYYLILEKQ